MSRWGMNFALLRFPLLSSLCPDSFQRIAADFPPPPAALGRCGWLARLAHLPAIFSTSYFFNLYHCKSWMGARTFILLLDKAIKNCCVPFLVTRSTGRLLAQHVWEWAVSAIKSLCAWQLHIFAGMYIYCCKLSAVQVPAKLMQYP